MNNDDLFDQTQSVSPNPSPDPQTGEADPLQPQDDIYNPVRDQEQLDQDGRPPAAQPDDVPAMLPSDHPVTDTDVDSQEVYDAGLDSASALPGSQPQQDNEAGPDDIRPLEPR